MESQSKFRFLLVFFTLIILLFLARLIYLQVFHHKNFTKKTSQQVQKKIDLASFRGRIYDQNSLPLALSSTAYSLYCNPEITKKQPVLTQDLLNLAQELAVPENSLKKCWQATEHFVWIKRKLPYETYTQVKPILPKGFLFVKEEKRVYPEQDLSADVLGFSGIDKGLGGIEYSFEKELKGSQGRVIIDGDTTGQRLLQSKKQITGTPTQLHIDHTNTPNVSFDGKDIYLTLHKQLQYRVERYLAEGIAKQEAVSGQALVLDIQSGAVLALADYPTFNPNSFYKSPYSILKNSAIVDVFEPGSIFKPITYAIGLELDTFKPDTQWELPEQLLIDNYPIREAHQREEDDDGIYSSEEIIMESLNVGTSLMAEAIGKTRFYDYIKRFGFGRRSQSELPGESPGILRSETQWSNTDIATISFGQGIAVNLLQMACAYAIIGNKGRYVNPTFIQKITNKNGTVIFKEPSKLTQKRIISEQSAHDTLMALEKTVQFGSGRRAYIPGFRVGGKTGTAQIPRLNGVGYKKGAYASSFVMILPIEQPRFVVAVAIFEAKKEYFGSRVALPIAKSIAYDLIDRYTLLPKRVPFTHTRHD